MAIRYICGFIDPTDPTLIVRVNAWTPDTPGNTIEAYTGAYSDALNPEDQGCKGKQLPGDPTVFYFVAVEYSSIGEIVATHLVKAKYDTTTGVIGLTHKPLPAMPGVIAIPKPNQLTVTTDGMVFMPVGSYDSPIVDDKQYYIDVTGTLSDDENDWTITPRYAVSSQGSLTHTEGTFCMCLSIDETQLFYYFRMESFSKGVYTYAQCTMLCNLDGSAPVSRNFFGVNPPLSYVASPLNIENCPNGYVFIAKFLDTWRIVNIGITNIARTDVSLTDNKGRAVSFKTDGNLLVINKSDECPANPNNVVEYAPVGGVPSSWLPTGNDTSMVCPQATPTHHDVYLPTDEPWTASGILGEEQGSVRQGATPDREVTTGYGYNCTAAPRDAV